MSEIMIFRFAKYSYMAERFIKHTKCRKYVIKMLHIYAEKVLLALFKYCVSILGRGEGGGLI